MQGPLLAVPQSPAPSRVKELGCLLGSTNKAPAQQQLPISEPSPPAPQLETAEMKAPLGRSSFASCITMTFPTREMRIGALPGFPSSGATGTVCELPRSCQLTCGREVGSFCSWPCGVGGKRSGEGGAGRGADRLGRTQWVHPRHLGSQRTNTCCQGPAGEHPLVSCEIHLMSCVLHF